MAGATVHRGGRAVRTAIMALTVAAPMLALATAPMAAATSPLPASHGVPLPQPVIEVDPLATPQLQLRPDRLLKSVVPGHVTDREDVRVAIGPSGVPTAVTDTQQLVINGAGNYIVRELGPAREA